MLGYSSAVLTNRMSDCDCNTVVVVGVVRSRTEYYGLRQARVTLEAQAPIDPGPVRAEV